MQLDYGRQNDLDMLYSDYQKARSVTDKQRVERVIDSILRETGTDRILRDELIKATRVGDKNRVQYVRQELRRLQAERVNNNIQL